MEFRSLQEVSYKVFIVALLCISASLCQNCGVPRTIDVKQSDRLTETLNTDQLITSISAQNVVRITVVEQHPGNFAKVEHDTNSSTISLRVDTPLWALSKPSISYIDEERVQKVNVSLFLDCSDGRSKQVTFNIPIKDENTEMPYFEKLDYVLTTEPCLADRCTLLFDSEIVVIDRDRELENAEVQIFDNSKEIELVIAFSSIEPWYEDVNDHKKLQKGFQSKVKLTYTPSKEHVQNTISFMLSARNNKDNVDIGHIFALTNITIKFEELENSFLPPVFSSPFYYAQVKYFGGMVNVKPVEIQATIPWDVDNNSQITYKIDGYPYPNVFGIDANGSVSFSSDLNQSLIDKLRNTEITYTVTAERTKTEPSHVTSVKAQVTLVVFFPDDNSEGPSTTTTNPICPPGCSTTPWPGTCPTPTCPDPDPCPSIPTTSTAPSEPTPTASTITSTSHEPTSEATFGPTTERPPESTVRPPDTTARPPITTSVPTTAQSTTTTSTTTWEPPTDPPAENCTCNCNQFSCENADQHGFWYITPTVTRHKDPYNCTVFHTCSSDSDDSEGSLEACPSGLIYCPKISNCTTVGDCLRLNGIPGRDNHSTLGYGDGGWDSSEFGEPGTSCDSHCLCLGSGLPPGDENNRCNNNNYETKIKDPIYCDIFHLCQPDGYGSYIDYAMRCPPGLVFSDTTHDCEHYNEIDCPRDKEFMQCDVCVMGQWPDFDLFTKRFTNNGTTTSPLIL